jgi:protein-tyrosine phosphatase
MSGVTHRVLFVCLGNICRSPTAEGVMLHLLRERGITSVTLDSAGTSAYHVGEPADARSQRVANQRGIHLPSRARQFTHSDFQRFDWILAMDVSNLQNILAMAQTEEERSKVHLFRDFEPGTPTGLSVPDPYYERNFDIVLDICENGCIGFLQSLGL